MVQAYCFRGTFACHLLSRMAMMKTCRVSSYAMCWYKQLAAAHLHLDLHLHSVQVQIYVQVSSCKLFVNRLLIPAVHRHIIGGGSCAGQATGGLGTLCGVVCCMPFGTQLLAPMPGRCASKWGRFTCHALVHVTCSCALCLTLSSKAHSSMLHVVTLQHRHKDA